MPIVPDTDCMQHAPCVLFATFEKSLATARDMDVAEYELTDQRPLRARSASISASWHTASRGENPSLFFCFRSAPPLIALNVIQTLNSRETETWINYNSIADVVTNDSWNVRSFAVIACVMRCALLSNFRLYISYASYTMHRRWIGRIIIIKCVPRGHKRGPCFAEKSTHTRWTNDVWINDYIYQYSTYCYHYY